MFQPKQTAKNPGLQASCEPFSAIVRAARRYRAGLVPAKLTSRESLMILYKTLFFRLTSEKSCYIAMRQMEL